MVLPLARVSLVKRFGRDGTFWLVWARASTGRDRPRYIDNESQPKPGLGSHDGGPVWSA